MVVWLRPVILFSFLSLCSCSARTAIIPGDIPAAPASSAEDLQYGNYVARQFSSTYSVSNNKADLQRVTGITNRLLKSATTSADQWNLVIFDEPTIANAAVTKGRYIFVWSGLFNETRNNDELAAILGHEIGHYLAGHHQKDTLESTTAGISGVFKGIGQASSRTRSYYSSGSSQLAEAVVGITSSLIGLTLDKAFVEPEKQRHELEADTIGLFMMAQAGYNPATAIDYWERMHESKSGDENRSAFRLNSHPSSEERLTNLRNLVGMAKARYESNPLRFVFDKSVPESKRKA